MSCSDLHRYADALRNHFDDIARAEVAGSIRRRKPDPHDIEIVLQPHGLAAFDNRMLELQMAGILYLDPNHKADGLRYKRRLYRSVAVDIFIVTPPAQWGVIFTLRTGPADFNTHIVTQRAHGGLMPTGMRVANGQLWSHGELVSTPEEADYFQAIGLPTWDPQHRTLANLHHYLKT